MRPIRLRVQCARDQTQRRGGQAKTGSSFEISAAQLPTLTYQAGATADQLWVRANDGLDWSAWQTFMLTPPVNHALRDSKR